MNLLLDTHVLLWSLFESDRLSDPARGLFTDTENDIFVSVFSFWEISLKYGLGKISLNNVLPEELPSIAQKAGMELLDADPRIVSTFYKLPKTYHKDPFDRMIIWQCIQSGYVLLSKDIQMKQYQEFGLKVKW